MASQRPAIVAYLNAVISKGPTVLLQLAASRLKHNSFIDKSGRKVITTIIISPQRQRRGGVSRLPRPPRQQRPLTSKCPVPLLLLLLYIRAKRCRPRSEYFTSDGCDPSLFPVGNHAYHKSNRRASFCTKQARANTILLDCIHRKSNADDTLLTPPRGWPADSDHSTKAPESYRSNQVNFMIIHRHEKVQISAAQQIIGHIF